MLEGIRVAVSATDDPAAGSALAAAADVSILCAGTSSGEALDRSGLSFPTSVDLLIRNVSLAAAARDPPAKSVLLAMAPGAVSAGSLVSSVGAALLLLLGGEKTGDAFASVIFGDHSPTGRLPVTLPAYE